MDDIRQARHRASVKWLLSKAFNNRVPDDLREPFYRDQENQERLKPKVVVDLGNATIYCQTLANLYSDPNYQSLNHWSILQTLARKGVAVPELPGIPLTETVLIQTNPLKFMAHMSVIESLMLLYVKEIISNERVKNAIKRLSGDNYQPSSAVNINVEQSLLLWVSHACSALKKRIERELATGLTTDQQGKRLQVPEIPPVRDYQDLFDGICLALLISYYCPNVLKWTDVRFNYLPAVEDSIHNVLLVSNFSQKHLPYNVFHMLPEDMTCMRGSMKLNLLVLLADLFNLFEIHPASCVCYPGMDPMDVIAKQNVGANEHGIYHRRGLAKHAVTPIPDLRSESDQAFTNVGATSTSNTITNLTSRNQFQVSNSANDMYKTLPAQQLQHSDVRIADNSHHFDNEAFVVHKSRGITTLSSMHHQQQQQQDPLIPARLRQSKEKHNCESKADERGDNIAAGRPSNWEQNRRTSYAGRRSRRNSSSEDSQLTIENFGGSQDQLNTIDRFERERDRERKFSNTTIEPTVAARSSISDARSTLQLGYDTDSGSEKQDHDNEKQNYSSTLKRQRSMENVALSMNSGTSGNRHNVPFGNNIAEATNKHSNSPEDILHEDREKSTANLTRKSSSASLNTKSTNWQNYQNDFYDDDTRSLENAYKLSNIRNKLEEKRRLIEQDKRRAEVAILRYHEKMNQDDLNADLLKWETMSNDSKRTSDIDPSELDKYQQSIAIMNMNLQDIQQDIQRLASQQNQIQAHQMQAHQLLQAQQIANLLNQQQQQQQQNFGSQQHLADAVYVPSRPLSHQQSCGSTPHLNNTMPQQHTSYGSRPPSRDPYQQQASPSSSYVNDGNAYTMYGGQIHIMPNSSYSGGVGGGCNNMLQMHYSKAENNGGVPYNNNGNHQHYPYNAVGTVGYNSIPTAYAVINQQHHGYPQVTYIPRKNIYDGEYGGSQSMHIREPNISPQARNSPFISDNVNSGMIPQYSTPSQRRTWGQPISIDQQQQQIYQNLNMSSHSSSHHPSPQSMDNAGWQSIPKRPLSTLSKSGDDGTDGSRLQQHQTNKQQCLVFHHNGESSAEMFTAIHSSPLQINQPNNRPSTADGVGAPEKFQPQNILISSTQEFNTTTQVIIGDGGVDSHKINSSLTPPDDMMAPQSICFIGDEDDVDELERNIIEKMQSTRLSEYSFPVHHNLESQQQEQLQQQQQQQQQQQPLQQHQFTEQMYFEQQDRVLQQQQAQQLSEEAMETNMIAQNLNITSGNLTYRIPSPQRRQLQANSFQDPKSTVNDVNEKGFYISFDDDQPKRPKPPLRAKRSPRKNKRTTESSSSTHTDIHGNQFANKSESDSLSGEGSCSNETELKMRTNYNNSNDNKNTTPNNNNNSQAQVRRYDDCGEMSINDESKATDTTTEVNRATYNKYTDSPIHLRQVIAMGSGKMMANTSNVMNNFTDGMDMNGDKFQKQNPTGDTRSPAAISRQKLEKNNDIKGQQSILIVGEESALDPRSMDEMERRKEKIMLMSLQRRQQQEEAKERKELAIQRKREMEREKDEEKQRKKEEQIARRAAILEQHRLKKALEEAEREGKTLDRTDLAHKSTVGGMSARDGNTHVTTRTRTTKGSSASAKPRPKTIHVDDGSVDISDVSSISSRGKKGSSSNITGQASTMRRDYYRGSHDSLTVKESPDDCPSTSSTPIGRRGSCKVFSSKEPNIERGRTLSRISLAKGKSLNFRGRKSNSLMNLCDSGIGGVTTTPLCRAPSPGMAVLGGRQMHLPAGPGSLPGLIIKRRPMPNDDGGATSDVTSPVMPNSMLDYAGPKLYKQPAAKSNRGIILNAVEYCVFPGAVNRDSKQKVLEKIARSEAKHFLILFRDAGCQFRALYSYVPESEQVCKLYGTGPSQVDALMFDKFFKYNSGGKCFSQVHTKHLTVTIDAFTIHNSLWQGKKVNLPSKKDMALII